ncbi:MAG: glycosyltransferase family 39 protein [Deltaproteobacteria bacterium]|nr:glycosyltransferase family 39 protein [Deltaproteobacteria bacterium]MCX7952010.1 glycosyltransferase family 39 protein [Deltaproteobacteria bacterium]
MKNRDFLLLVLTFLVLTGPYAFFADLHTRGEGREALNFESACREDPLWPKNYDDKRSSKPPMYYWVGCLLSFGTINEFTIRIPSLLSGLLLIALTVLLGNKNHKSKTGILAGFLLLTSPQFIASSETARLDMLHSSLLAISWMLLISCSSVWVYVISALCLAGSSLTKGPVAIILSILVFGVHFLIHKDLRKFLAFLAVILTAGLMAGIWYILVIGKYGEEFIKIFFSENIARYLSEDVPHNKPFYEFLMLYLLSLGPVVLLSWLSKVIVYWRHIPMHLRVLVRDIIEQLRKEPFFAFLIIASIIPVAFFCFSSGKRVPYALVSFPFIAILTGISLAKFSREEKIVYYKLFHVTFIAFMSGLVGAALFGGLYASFSDDYFLKKHMYLFLLSFIFAALILIVHQRLRYINIFNPFSGFTRSSITVTILSFFLFNTVIGTMLADALSHKKLASWLKRINDQNIPIYSFQYQFYATDFYHEQKIETYNASAKPPYFLLVPSTKLDKLIDIFKYTNKMPIPHANYQGRVDKLWLRVFLYKIE